MKFRKLFIILILAGFVSNSNAQFNKIFHEGNFGEFTGMMSSREYVPDSWEIGYFNYSSKNIFPQDLVKNPENYKYKFIHLIGIVTKTEITQNGDTSIVTISLENKYWDYIEDYSIQDEKMFVSPLGSGEFKIIYKILKLKEKENNLISNFATDKKLLFCYGEFMNCEDSIPILKGICAKMVDYKYYTTTIMSYDIERDSNGLVITEENGFPKLINFKYLNIAGPGQNKN